MCFVSFPPRYQLWDHIVSAPSYFFVFIVVAFNCIQRPVIERLVNAKEIKAYFNEPCTINMKHWLRTAYAQMSKCPKNLHPKQYIQHYVCLGIDQHYRKILNYPHIEFNIRMKQKKQLQDQMQCISRKYMELETFEMKLMQRIVNDVQSTEHQQRMQNVQLAHELAFVNQLKRVENQKRHLILAERQLNYREYMMKIMLKENNTQNNVNTSEVHLKKALLDMIKLVRFFLTMKKKTV